MTSFAPKDFSRAKWHGGPATLTNPRFQYRKFTPQVGRNAGQEVKNVASFLEFLDPEGNEHRAQYDVGDAQYCQIKESPAKDADEAEIGPSIASPDPNRGYSVYPDSDFGKFIASLVNGGFDESKLLDGDITVIDGLEVEVYEQPRKEGDKFPLLLIKSGSVKVKGGATKTGKPANKPAADAGDVKSVADAFVIEATTAAGGTITQAALVKQAMGDAGVKASGLRADVVAYLSKKDNLADNDAWLYDAADKTITIVG